ncbi:uncharacterized protein PV07_05622 [Cladophialophora immunda]|uniref:Uncharacterized protein n=1 Tax=Cladophialophora immunda TaxID=569365 RepID=A0A0D2CI42_9EURO|nr:uncharacterized protein PV07_05622 [Cladophialophora immunda]KIW29835.1 hypothetical protein PV07_05622 [Cladophialophora immunda]
MLLLKLKDALRADGTREHLAKPAVAQEGDAVVHASPPGFQRCGDSATAVSERCGENKRWELAQLHLYSVPIHLSLCHPYLVKWLKRRPMCHGFIDAHGRRDSSTPILWTESTSEG